MLKNPSVESGAVELPERITIVGLGIMGASLALALKARGYTGMITGVARTDATCASALARGAVDAATTDLRTGLAEADLVVLATPARLLIDQIKVCGEICKDGAVITDMGSTKSAIVAAMNGLPARLSAVGGHPMCGKEKAGIDAAEAGLYVGAPWIVTPTDRSNDDALAMVRALASFVGARSREIAFADHDRLLAYASHLPYALSVALVTATDHFGASRPEVWEVMAGGFRDTSRVSASDETMWTDILLTNSGPLLAAIRDAQFALDQLGALIERGDEAGLRATLGAAARARRSHYPG